MNYLLLFLFYLFKKQKNIYFFLKLWEKRYIHSEYFEILKPEVKVPQPCPDVYDFPFLTERFCREIIQVMENYNQWSSGDNIVKYFYFFFCYKIIKLNLI